MADRETPAQRRKRKALQLHVMKTIPRISLNNAPMFLATSTTDQGPVRLSEMVFGCDGRVIFDSEAVPCLPYLVSILDLCLNKHNWGYADGCTAIILPPDIVSIKGAFLIYRTATVDNPKSVGRILFSDNGDWELAPIGIVAKCDTAIEFVVGYDAEHKRAARLPRGRKTLRDSETYWSAECPAELHLLMLFGVPEGVRMDNEVADVSFERFRRYVVEFGILPAQSIAFLVTKEEHS